MRKPIFHYLIAVALLLLALTAVACRRTADVPPTAAPTAVSSPPTAPATAVPSPTAAPPATAVPELPTTGIPPEAIDWPPQIVYSSPAPGEEALLDGAITLRFDQPMAQAAVESAFSIEPAVAGAFAWPRPDTLVFTPQGALKRQQLYRVRLGTTAVAQNGLALAQPVELDLKTVGFLRVSQALPAPGASGIETDAAITVVFNRPVVPLVSGADQAGLPQPLSISPAVAGEGRWVSTSIYRFVPDAPLAGATTYRLTVPAGLADVVGGVLDEPYAWQFTTLNPSLAGVTPENGANLVAPTTPITLTFNMPMDRTTVETAVALRSDDAPAPALDFTWQPGDRAVVIRPRAPLALAANYQLVVAQSARSASGQASLDRETRSGFSTAPFPAVTRVDPAPGGEANPFQGGVSIEFASPMDLATLEDRVQIEPAPARVDYFYNEYIDPFSVINTNFSLYLNFELARNAEYRITLPADVADPYGNTLGEPYVWRFTTPGYPPVAAFNLSGRINQLSTSFPTAVEVIHRNVSQLEVTLYDVGLPLGLINEPYQVEEYRPAVDPRAGYRQRVAAPRDQVGVAAFGLAPTGSGPGERLPTGVYLASVSAPELDPDARYWQNRRSLLIVADTNVVVKEMFGRVHVWVTELESGTPARGRALTLYSRRGAQVATAVSDANGFASFEYTAPEEYLAGVTVVSGQPGDAGFGVGSSVWSGNVSPWQLGINTGGPPLQPFVYLYTDRPIYRPGDTVYYKGIVRRAQDGRYALPEPQTLAVTLGTRFYSEAPGLSETFSVTVGPDGLFSGEYTLPADVTLGSYEFRTEGNYEAARPFTVAEYRKPEYLVTLTPVRPEARRGEAVDVVLEASYFFGGSATGLTVDWSLYVDSFYPAVDAGARYAFDDRGDWFYASSGPFGPFGGGGALGEYLQGGQGVTDADGRLTITLPADLLKEVEAGSRLINVEANVSDLANFPIYSRAAVVLHAADVYVGVAPSDYVAAVGRPAGVDLLTVDWDGRRAPNQNVEVVFYRREWERSRAARFGIYFTEWTPVDTEVARTAVTTNAQGAAAAEFTPEAGGTYLAVATVTDRGGRVHTSSATLWAIDPTYAGWRTDPQQRSMELIADQSSYRVGDTARILVQSPFAQPVQAWLTIERDTLIEQRVVTLEGGSAVLDLPITPLYAPNVYVTITAVKPVDRDDPDNPYADIRLGIVELEVAPEQLALNVALTPRAERFTPGETVTYDILVTDYLGAPVTAEISLALVDLAVLTLREDNAPPILDAFYAPQPYRSQIGSGLFVTGEGLEPEIPLEGGGLGGGGGDGMAEAALGMLPQDEDDDAVRRDFPDTAFWRASVQTDANGRASVDVPLPDSLTTWRLSSKAVTADSLVGQASVDVVVSLPLLIRPQTPRFFTAGDVVQLGAIVNNNTAEPIEATVSLAATGLTLTDPIPQSVTVPANGRVLVRWEVTVEDAPLADLTFRVAGGGYQDAAKPPLGVGPDNLIPVYRYSAQDIVGTAGVLDTADRRVEAVLLPANVDARRGSVDVTLSPSLAAAILDALSVLNDADVSPACAHALTDRLLPNLAVAQAIAQLGLDEPDLAAQLDVLIPADLRQLEGQARPDGGWGWCGGRESSPWLSAYSLLALARAQEAGFAVDTVVIERAMLYLERQLRPMERLPNASAVNRQTFFLYVLAESGVFVDADADELATAHRELLDPYARALLVLVYSLNNPASPTLPALLSDLNNSAIVSAAGAHWEDGERDFANLNSNVRGTAIVIDALARAAPDSPLAPSAVRWLMTARTAQRWPTQHETAWAILALTEWMATTGELEAGYPYQLNVNAAPVLEGAFTRQTVATSAALSLPVGGLLPDEPNFFDFRRGEGDGRLYYSLYLNSFVSAETVEAASRGVTVQRAYYDAACDPVAASCTPLDSIRAGRQVRVELTVIAPNDLVYAVVEDPLPAGAEAVDPGLATTAARLGGGITRSDADYRYGYWGWWVFNNIEYRDEKVVFLAEFLPAGTYQYTYTLQTNIPGVYQVMPAIAYEQFFPDVFGRSAGFLFTIAEE